MANGKKTRPSFSTGRKWSIGFNVVVATVAVLGLVVMANYLGVRHFLRFQLADRGQVKLAPRTVSVLQSLTNQVKVTIFFDAQGEEEVYGLVSSLLKEYSYINPDVIVKTVDPTRDPGKAQLLLAESKLTNLQDKNFVIFDSGGQTRIVNQNELSHYDYDGKEFRRIGFKGEMLFTSAIYRVAHPRQIKACYLQGHREHDPELGGDHLGYAKFAQLLEEQNNIRLETMTLQGTNEVPPDCQLLIIAGPQIPLVDGELEKVQNYLKQGGRLFALLGNMVRCKRSGLEKILAQWGVGVADDVIYDDKFSPTKGDDLLTAWLDPQHPVVKSLMAEKQPVRLVLPRAVYQLKLITPSVDAPQVDILAGTSKGGTETTNFHGVLPYRNDLDAKGAFPLMVAVEQGSIKGVSTDRGSTRIVVVGDSLCMDNQMINDWPPNYYFASQAVNWLLDSPQSVLSGLSSRPLKEYKLIMTESQRQSVQWLLLAGLPGAVLLLGSLVWLRRRR